MLGGLFFYYKSLRQFTQSSTAWLGIFPLIFFYGFTQEYDFVHYSSELLSVLLLNVSLWIYLRLNQGLHKYQSEWFLLGLILGIIPFCKLQAVPIALIIGIFGLWNAHKKNTGWQNIILLISGSVFFLVIVLVWLFYHHLWDDFWTFNIEGNLVYGKQIEFIQKIINLYRFLRNSTNFSFFSLSFIPLLIYGWKNTKNNTQLGLAISLVLASIFAVLKTGNIFNHYLHLLLYPLAFIAFTIGKDKLNSRSTLWVTWIGIIWFLGNTKFKASELAKPYLTYEPYLQKSPASKLILQYANNNDRMAIWGWVCKYHVETQIPQGATESHPERCVLENPLREKYYKRYIQDIKYKKPKIFVDAVAPNRLFMDNRNVHSHEYFPELKKLIDLHYIFVGETDQSRIYVRRDDTSIPSL
ncbi:MAG: hypothetical protein ACK4UP_12730 [Spirosomataceae bacterium]